MAEITFLATDDDCDAIWAMIFRELGMTAYPDPWFGELPAPALATPADVSANPAQYGSSEKFCNTTSEEQATQ
jgi:hypothetical protein